MMQPAITKPPSLKRIRTAIEKVARMVDSNPAAREVLAPEIAAILEKARRLRAASKGRKLSFIDYLCGLALRQEFEQTFGMRATTALNGRYARFAEAWLKKHGVKGRTHETISRKTIIRSMTAAKKYRAKQMGKN